MSRGLGKKPPLMVTPEFDRMVDGISKAALIDALWCACQLGTNESHTEIRVQAARNISAALYARGDRIPAVVAEAAICTLESDPPE